MTEKKNDNILYVYMNGVAVGLLTVERSQLQFRYADEWLQWELGRPLSLSMPLTELPYKGAVVENFFDNLLPDSDLIRKRIQARFQAATDKCFDLLSFIGRDCVGALQLLTQPSSPKIKTIKARPIPNSLIADLLKHYQSAPLGMSRDFDFRISIAGAQEKTALLWHNNQWCLPEGATPTSHIIKLPIGIIAHAGIDLSTSVENEWLCLQILAAFHLPVNHAKMTHFNEVKTLVVERFDREWSENKTWLMRLPQEDFCQALNVPSALKYQSDGGPGIQEIMNLLLGSQDSRKDRYQFMKSLFLFWILGATDGHAKNFSLRLGPQGSYRLSPLYDVISVYPIAAKRQIEWHRIKMAMALKGKSTHYQWSSIQKRHWFSMAERCQFGADLMEEIMTEVCDTLEEVIQEVSQKLPKDFPSAIADPIFEGMRKVKNRCK